MTGKRNSVKTYVTWAGGELRKEEWRGKHVGVTRKRFVQTADSAVHFGSDAAARQIQTNRRNAVKQGFDAICVFAAVT